jgi:hypothetical protein
VWRKTVVRAKRNWFQPIFAFPFLVLRMYMQRFITVKTEKEEPKRSRNTFNGWHASSEPSPWLHWEEFIISTIIFKAAKLSIPALSPDRQLDIRKPELPAERQLSAPGQGIPTAGARDW